MIYRYIRNFIILVVLACSGFAGTANADRSEITVQPHLEAQLLSEYAQVSPGQTLTIAAKLVPEEGWHTYWMNPGDSGLATVIHWTLPESVSAEPIQWPVAEKFDIGPLSNYGFEGVTYLLSDLHIPADFNEPTLHIEARVEWLVCEEWCIPGHAEFSLDIPVGEAQLSATNAASFTVARNSLPAIEDWPARFDIQARQVTLLVEHEHAVDIAQSDNFYAYVGAGELVEHQETGDVQVTEDSVIIRRTLNTYFHETPTSFPLLLVGDSQAVQVEIHYAGSSSTAPTSAVDTSVQPLALMLGFAFVGGLLLNLMPCVFPVLSLKALHVANTHNRKSDTFWYTAGVVNTFVLFAALLLLLRAAGQALGWGFQLQNPWLIASLTFLFVAIGLNLSGVFQVGTRLMQLGGKQVPEHGAKGSFATGVLAVIIASPCTAPLMGAALGFAITQSSPLALSIFATLGLGMASPFIALAFIPALSNRLPKPGQWMDTFKQWMAIPMYLTSVWLVWVFGRQAGIDSLALLLIGVVLFATGLWWLGKQQLAGKRRVGQRIVVAVLFAIAAIALALAMQLQSRTTSTTSENQHWQAWSPEQLADLKNSQPVFVNMTADWCITCLANERVALETSATRALFREYNIAYLKGDWTLQDERITDYLAQYQRNGVPLYVLYWPGEEPQVLPQILTNNVIRDAVKQSR